MLRIWATSINVRLSYWRLTTDFRPFLGGAPTLPWVIWKTRGPICTKFAGDILRSSLHTQFKNDEDILVGLQPTGAQIWAFVSDKAKNRTFWPAVKIRGVVREMSRYFGVVVHMTEPPAYILWAAASPFGWAKGE